MAVIERVLHAAQATPSAGRQDIGQRCAGGVINDFRRRAPTPPFTTSTLQQEAARRLGFGIGETMQFAQRLYEGVGLEEETTGLITYMRTDSTVMAKTAVAEARAVARDRFGDAYVAAKPRVFRSRERPGATPLFAREAHEAIRAADFSRVLEALAGCLDRAAEQLYGLIWKRAMASQMTVARFDRARVEPGTEAGDIVLAASGSGRTAHAARSMCCGSWGRIRATGRPYG